MYIMIICINKVLLQILKDVFFESYNPNLQFLTQKYIKKLHNIKFSKRRQVPTVREILKVLGLLLQAEFKVIFSPVGNTSSKMPTETIECRTWSGNKIKALSGSYFICENK